MDVYDLYVAKSIFLQLEIIEWLCGPHLTCLSKQFAQNRWQEQDGIIKQIGKVKVSFGLGWCPDQSDTESNLLMK